MQTFKVIFADNNKPASLLIKLFTLSWWSHCAILDGDFVIDATLASGVRRIPYREWEEHYTYHEAVNFPCANKDKAIEFARAQVGKSYDWLGILSFIFRKNYEDTSKWFCSELVAEASGIFKTNLIYTLSPQWLRKFYKVVKELK
jgi:uncharacterized protein YycO